MSGQAADTAPAPIKDTRTLRPGALEAMAASDKDRIDYVRRDKWIQYPAAQEILEDLGDLMTHPKRSRMPCRLIISHTNNGKTNLLKEFMRRHPVDPNVEGEAIKIPVVRIELVEPDERHLYLELLKALYQEYPVNATLAARRDQALTVLKQVGPQMIILDEINTLIAGSVVKQRSCLNALKHISNTLAVPVVAAGTSEARHVFRTEPQIANRFEPRTLPLWKADNVLRGLLHAFENHLPLREPSRLASKEMSLDIYQRTGGTIGEISKLLEEAAIYAIKGSAERITREVLDGCKYHAPSRRDAVLNYG